MTEDFIQRTIFQHYAQRHEPGAVMFHIPNGGARHAAVAAKLRAAGVKKGAPDLFCASISHGAFFIELKREKGRLSANQADMIQRLASAGVKTHVAYGLDSALSILEETGILRRA